MVILMHTDGRYGADYMRYAPFNTIEDAILAAQKDTEFSSGRLETDCGIIDIHKVVLMEGKKITTMIVFGKAEE